MTRVVFEPDLDAAARDIADWLPGSPWTPDLLSDHCVVLRAGEHALIWLEWLPGSDRVLVAHMAARPAVRGRWFSQAVVDQVAALARLMNANALSGSVLAGHSPTMQRWLRRYGFRDEDGNSVLKIS